MQDTLTDYELHDEGDDAQDERVLHIESVAAAGFDLVSALSSELRAQIGTKCLEAYERDLAERAEWEENYDSIMEMVSGEREPKSFPFPNASNVSYPVIMTAALQFGARAYPAIVNGADVAKVASIGADEDGRKRSRGQRVTTHLNYQLLHDMPEWDTDTDRLCHALPIQGVMFRQVVWGPEYSRPKTALVSGKDLVVTQNAKDLETVPHFAKRFYLFPHQLSEKMRSGEFLEADLCIDEDAEDAGAQEMLECHFRYDIDEDGYEEPWIAVIHKESEQVLSVKTGFWPSGVRRGVDGRVVSVRRHVDFIKYEFLPDPNGKFYGIGFGQLLLEHTRIINSLINQLIDAATDQNAGGGFIGRGVNMPGGVMRIAPGEWKFINATGMSVREALVPRPTSQPSPVMFQLLGLMIESAKELSSVRDVMSGEVSANQPATTTLAIIEQGMQVFSSIYKRIYRSLTQELRLISRLNAAYLPLEEYMAVLDEQADPAQDYLESDRDIVPVADPSITTSAQKLARAQFLMSVGAGNPMLDQGEILKRVLEAANIDEIESLMAQPDPAEMQKQQEMMQIELRKVLAEIMADEAGAAEDIASARLKEVEASVKAQEAAINIAAMRWSAQRLLGEVYGRQAMEGMGGVSGAPQGAGAFAGPAPARGAQQGGMGASPMGAGWPEPGQPANAGTQIPGADIQSFVTPE